MLSRSGTTVQPLLTTPASPWHKCQPLFHKTSFSSRCDGVMARPTLYYRNIEVYNNSDRLAPNVSCPFLFAADSGQDDPQYGRCSEIASSRRLNQKGEACKRVIAHNDVTSGTSTPSGPSRVCWDIFPKRLWVGARNVWRSSFCCCNNDCSHLRRT